VQQNISFSEDQRWPTKSERYGWFIAMGIAIFVAVPLNLHLFAPLVAFPVLVLLIFLVLTVLTLQQRLVVRIGLLAVDDDDSPLIGRFLRRAARAVPIAGSGSESDRVYAIRISYRFKSPISTLAPGRRGARIGRVERHVPLKDVERWYAGRMPAMTPFLRAGKAFPVGFHRGAVVIELASGEKLTIPTRDQPALLEALSATKVAAVRREQAPARVREEL
jgi:hypothetical protein